MSTRRTRLIIRQSRRNGPFMVGYWDRKTTANPDQDFRCFGIKPSAQEATALADKVIAERPREYFRE